jgi:hypothetical protein
MKVLSFSTDIITTITTTTTISEFSLMFDQSYSANSVYIAFKTSFKLCFKLLDKFYPDFIYSTDYFTVSSQCKSLPFSKPLYKAMKESLPRESYYNTLYKKLT